LDPITNLPTSLVPSWKRSQQYGVDPRRANNDLLSKGELNDRKKQMQEWLGASSDILNQVYGQLRNSPYMVIVSDRDGYVIFTWGDPPFTDQVKKVRLDEGANWHERIKGTNAIGTALVEQQPISVVGEQHFCEENRFLTCYATPLYTPTGELLGVLDITGDARMHHPHTMGMVLAAAQACQSRLLLQSARRELVLSFREADTLAEGYGRPLIAVDENGLVSRINQEAARWLNMPQAACIGQPLTRWFDPQDAEALLSFKESTEIPVRVKASSGKSWIARPVLDERKRTHRVLLSPPSPTGQEVSARSASRSLSTEEPGHVSLEYGISSCPKFQKVLKLAVHVARTDATILLRGETGTGKDLVAREIHKRSGRTGPLVVVNCGAIPEPLLEAELFGYEKGAFTGARNGGHRGKFEAAHKGTLFLDEIGEMPLASQAVLLRILEEKQVTRIGSNRPIPVDVRIITATNKDLAREVRENRFRADLYYRICEVEIQLPPLRERSDLFLLAEYFLDQIARELNIAPIPLNNEVREMLSRYHWPGNIRELRQVLRQAVYHAHFVRGSSSLTTEDLVFPQAQANDLPASPRPVSLEEQEAETIARAIRISQGNLSKAARILGIGRTTLYRKLNRYPNLKKIRAQH
jgi:sigma-54 dependent transcriptional regulator, acetoin dehydrogenase operon transcriptional activator AcoR